MISSSRPPFILAFVADQMGCGHHRAIVPLSVLMATGVADGSASMQGFTKQQFRAAKPDVVVVQRQIEEGQIEMIRECREALPEAHIVYEVDDYLAGVPEQSFHSGFIPPGIEERIRRALSYCDAASTTTAELAEWLRDLGMKDVRVIPNLLPAGQVRPRHERPRGKLRIGWGGGISHKGDLALLYAAMAEIGNEVEWVFLGMHPENCPIEVEFHPGVAPNQYLDTLHKLSLDLVLAPLEDNKFNNCKSNLRLLEGGACEAAVIAQDATTYHTDDPPVFGYAKTPDDWAREIKRFIATSAYDRKKSGRVMRSWVGKHYTFEARLEERLRAWLPRDAAIFMPRQAKEPAKAPVIVVSAGGQVNVTLSKQLHGAPFEVSLEAACQRSLAEGGDVLWLRPGTTLTHDALARLRAALVAEQDIGAVIPLSSDGVNGFPQKQNFSPASAEMVQLIDEAFRTRNPGGRLDTFLLGGPAMLLRGRALSVVGIPDCEGCRGSDEAALLEWGVRAAMRQWRFKQITDAYAASYVPPAPHDQELIYRVQSRDRLQVLQRPIEPLSDDLREQVDLAVVRKHWNGLRPGMHGLDSSYATWIALRGRIEVPEGKRADIAHCKFGDPIPSAEWIVFTDSSVELKPNAVERLAYEAKAATKYAVVVYGDNEAVMGNGQVVPDFKPAFDYELFLARDYVTPICAVHRSLFKGRHVKDRVELFDSILEAVHDSGKIGTKLQQIVHHVPIVMARLTEATPEERALTTLQRQIVVDMALGNVADVEVISVMPGCLKIKRNWQSLQKDAPLVSIIMPTKGSGWMLQPAINTVLSLTKYQNYEILVVHNGKGIPEIGSKALEDPRVRWTAWPKPYNWSALNNDAVHRDAHGSVLCFMNDDIRVTAPEWLDLMVAQALREDVCAVGAKLVHPMNVVQHVGVISHRGVNFHIHKGLPVQYAGTWNIAALTHENAAVTGACMVVEREKFLALGGFDESLAHNYNDVAFCLEARRKGWRNITEIGAELQHLEGATREATSPQGLAWMKEEARIMGARYLEEDPYWSPNMAFSVSPDGPFVSGFNCDMLAWPDTPPPEDAERVLVINDKGGLGSTAVQETMAGAVVFTAEVQSFGIVLVSPMSANVRPLDVRDPERVKMALTQLGVSRIVFCGLGKGASLETLRCMEATGIPTDYIPTDLESVCPRRDMTQDGRDCDNGWQKGAAHCQACIDRFGSPFGVVDMESWRRGWNRFALQARKVTGLSGEAVLVAANEEISDAAD